MTEREKRGNAGHYFKCRAAYLLFLFLFLLWGSDTLKVQARDAAAKVLTPAASGNQTCVSDAAALDFSNASSGYVMLKYSGNNPKVRFRITTPAGVNYTYFVTDYGNYMVYPLSGGDGSYTFTVYEAVSAQDNLYTPALSKSVSVKITNSFLPFLYPNCYVNFNSSSDCVRKASELAEGCEKDLDLVSAVYHYETGNIRYDDNKARTVQSGYTPFPDNTLASGTGICFDYASLMSAMLRSQGIPARLEVGYVGDVYHAWVSCYISDIGWVDGIIRFDGTKWTMMDPTMAAGQSPKSFAKFLKNNIYTVKYLY